MSDEIKNAKRIAELNDRFRLRLGIVFTLISLCAPSRAILADTMRVLIFQTGLFQHLQT